MLVTVRNQFRFRERNAHYAASDPGSPAILTKRSRSFFKKFVRQTLYQGHQARIVVDHKGIEAVAATAVAVAASGAGPAKLRVDRPFLYLIHDAETVTPLFLGRVTNPTA